MKLLDSIQRWLLLGIIAIVPFFFLPVTAEFFVTQKAFILLFGVLVSVVIVALQILTSSKVYTVKTAFGYILLTFFVIRAVSVFFASPNRIQALYSFPTGLMVFGSLTALYFLLTYVAGVQRERLPVLKALQIGTVMASLAVIFFYFKPLEGFSLPQNWIFLKGQFSPMGNGLESLVLLGFSIVLLGTSIFGSIKKQKHNGLIQSLIGLGISAIALIIIGVIVFKPVDQQASLRMPPFSISWYSALETLKSPKSAVIGAGVDNFDSVFTRAKTPAYNATDMWGVNFALARSSVLHIWAESGLLGLLALLIVAVYVIRELNGLAENKDPDTLVYMAGGVYIGLMLLLVPPSFMAFFTTFVYLAALAQQSMEHEKEPVREFDLHKNVAVYVGVAVALLALVGGVGYYTSRVYASELYFKKSIDAIRSNNGQAVYQNLKIAVQMQPRNERFRAQFAQINLLLANNIARRATEAAGGAGADGETTDPQAKTELSEKDRQAIAQFIQQAIAEGKALVSLNPQRAGNWNTLAVIYRNITNVAEGAHAWTIAAYQEAIRRDPQNPQLRLNLGGVYYGSQEFPQAITHFQQAVALKPNWANAQYNLAWALYQNKQYSEAASVMKNVLQLIDKKSKDYSVAQENAKLFDEKADEATTSGTVKAVEPDKGATGQPDSEPLTLPATPEAVLSPALKLPEGSGPENTAPAETAPEITPTPSQ